jgi:hypothetical protein
VTRDRRIDLIGTVSLPNYRVEDMDLFRSRLCKKNELELNFNITDKKIR